jgi:hypothetical protein
MKRRVLPMLVTLNLALVVVLVAMWFDRGGQLRNARWTPPAAIKPDFTAMLSPLARQNADDVSRFVATLDRPLFSPNRRPPPPPVVVAAPPPDPLANIQLFGVYSGSGAGGIIARVDGKMRRASVNDKIGEWTIKQIVDRDVTFVRGGESRIISLKRGKSPGSAPATSSAVQVIPGQSPPRMSEEERIRTMTGAQRIEEENRERLRYLNEMNTKNGLPPIINR